MKLRTSLTSVVVVPLALGMVACLLVAIIPLYNVTTVWNNKASEAVQSMQLSATTVRLDKMNEHLQVLYSQIEHDLDFLRNATYYALENQTSISMYPPTFYGVPISGGLPLPPPQEDKSPLFQSTRTGAGFERYSAALQQGKSTMTDVLKSEFAQPTALIDPLLKALYKTNRGGNMNRPEYYMKLMMGFEDSFYRRYPFPSASGGFPTDYTDGSTLYCDPVQDVAFIGLTAYHPQCRPWYRQAKQAWQERRSLGIDHADEHVIFSTPYIDAATKTVTISGSTPLMHRARSGQSFIGVINIDFDMSAIDRAVGGTSVGTSGYCFLMTKNGIIISHPRYLDKSTPRSVSELEPGLEATWTELLSKTLLSLTTRTPRLTTDLLSGRTVYIAATANARIGYILVTILPQQSFVDVHASSLDDLRGDLAEGTAAVVIIVTVLLIVLLVSTIRGADHYASTLNDATVILQQQNKPDLQAQMMVREPVCYELDLLFRQFPPMLVAIRFGNDKFYDGNLQQALVDYDVAETLMQRMKNRKGLAKVHNNKGNVYLKQSKYLNALEQYQASIRIGDELLLDVTTRLEHLDAELVIKEQKRLTLKYRAGSHGNDEMKEQNRLDVAPGVVVHVQPVTETNQAFEEKRDLQHERVQLLIALAKRHANLGVLYKTQDHTAAAYEAMERAVQLHQRADNDVGMAQVSSNLAQCYLQDGRIPEAESLIMRTYGQLSVISPDHKPDPSSLQYATLTLGLLCQAQCRWDSAAGWFQFTLQLQEQHKITDAQVQQNCFERLTFVFTQMQRPDMADKYRRLQHRAQVLKNVLFTLDTSGSMAGSRIESCRNSISNIIQRYIEAEDRVGLVTFNKTSKTILPLSFRGWDAATLSQMLSIVQNDTVPGGQTAFWDALVLAIQQMRSVAVKENTVAASAPPSNEQRNNWIIALTDGEDNVSIHSAEQVRASLLAFPVHLVIITVGAAYDKASVKRLVEAVKICHKQGHHIAIETESIDLAFQNVAKLITMHLNVESL